MTIMKARYRCQKITFPSSKLPKPRLSSKHRAMCRTLSFEFRTLFPISLPTIKWCPDLWSADQYRPKKHHFQSISFLLSFRRRESKIISLNFADLECGPLRTDLNSPVHISKWNQTQTIEMWLISFSSMISWIKSFLVEDGFVHTQKSERRNVPKIEWRKERSLRILWAKLWTRDPTRRETVEWVARKTFFCFLRQTNKSLVEM